jgi:hypothetical protein
MKIAFHHDAARRPIAQVVALAEQMVSQAVSLPAGDRSYSEIGWSR